MENELITFGKYKHHGMTFGQIPDSYLKGIYVGKQYQNEDIKKYIEIRLGIQKPKPLHVPCNKHAYPNKKEANFKLRVIRETAQDHKRPKRAYECPNCGQWHLTSKKSHK